MRSAESRRRLPAVPVYQYEFHHRDGHVERKMTESFSITFDPGDSYVDENRQVWYVEEVRPHNLFAATIVVTKDKPDS